MKPAIEHTVELRTAVTWEADRAEARARLHSRHLGLLCKQEPSGAVEGNARGQHALHAIAPM